MLPSDLLDYLGGQFRRGRVVLFTGAGFSLNATNPSGVSLPAVNELKTSLWGICFPGKPLDETSALQDLFELARNRKRGELEDLLLDRLTVDANNLPDEYRLWFSMPWHRVYTLNVDDLAVAASRQFGLPRRVKSVSATRRDDRYMKRAEYPTLEVIHLNGALDDIPDGVTFSTTQYAERLAQQEPWYVRCVADVLTHPVVFVGTRLDEPPLWQHIQFRKDRGARGLREMRRKSYLVTPHIDDARRELLFREFNVEHIPMTTAEFANDVLADLRDEAAEGLEVIRLSVGGSDDRVESSIPDVTVLASEEHPLKSTEYLLGAEPTWADLQAGRAIHREIDDDLRSVVRAASELSGPKGILLVTGTAGSGKSTALMRLGLSLAGEGVTVGWIDRDIELGPRDIRRLMGKDDGPDILVIDDADLYGTEMAVLGREVCRYQNHPLLILAVRSSRADRLADRFTRIDVPFVEKRMPHLADSDIASLLEILDRENRLGVLKGQSRSKQEAVFREKAGRQLLVAMLEATSDRRFEDRIVDEVADLNEDARAVYGLVAVATALRFSLQRDEILLAVQDASNATLNTIEELLKRHLLVLRQRDGSLAVRHWMIGSVVLDYMGKEGSAAGAISRLAFAAATKVSPGLRRGSKPWRRLKALTNHEFLIGVVGRKAAAEIYENLEQLLNWDYHYWLQRGSLELETGDIRLAENFLGQAYSMASSDYLVQTEYAYLLIRLAIDSPISPEAPRRVEDGFEMLDAVIQARGETDSYPYHILGSQGLAWSRRASFTRTARLKLLERLLERVKEGAKAHPRLQELKKLEKAIHTELLTMAVEYAP